jgi:uncharacterized small protein (DUF1192 family)
METDLRHQIAVLQKELEELKAQRTTPS